MSLLHEKTTKLYTFKEMATEFSRNSGLCTLIISVFTRGFSQDQIEFC